MRWRRQRARGSREVAFAEWIAISLAKDEVTPIEMIAGLYVTTPRLAAYWDSPRHFVAFVRGSAGLRQSRCAYWRLLLNCADARPLSAGMLAVRRTAEELAKEPTLNSRRCAGRGGNRPPEIAAEHLLLSAAQVRASGLTDALINSGLQLDLLRAAVAAGGFGVRQSSAADQGRYEKRRRPER